MMYHIDYFYESPYYCIIFKLIFLNKIFEICSIDLGNYVKYIIFHRCLYVKCNNINKLILYLIINADQYGCSNNIYVNL